ncbi:MAG: hypothetical protein ACYC6O_06025 [Thermoleophilia bacterium]
MPANIMSGKFGRRKLEAMELSCSWCASAVPLPAGEHSGVCIDCGTVMFRGDPVFEGASERRNSWGMGSPMNPAPAV